ncbi:molybdopterin converting factor subunit 1 [Oleomonas cavernae]|uniref:Molybdopterin synthase sulfur carrier subunit n=1 Tax=Oleomonas cavernae TaxID=2320859 RepID=A0A418WDZ0_9PROT|nr:molybdopterin converting factor subunit 1 [Oleomonas cavernae]RJF88231.1 molybdopterin converting factor subunit 1 [Oleomonas cavernae]
MRVLYFAWVRERVGVPEEEFALPAAVGTVGALLDLLEARSAGHAAALADRSAIRIAVNQDFATPETAVAPHDEVAIFPPVTGG